MYQHIDSLKEKTADLISKELYNSYKAEIREQYLRFEKLRNQIDGIFATEKTPAKIAEAIHGILEYSVYEEEGKDFELVLMIAVLRAQWLMTAQGPAGVRS